MKIYKIPFLQVEPSAGLYNYLGIIYFIWDYVNYIISDYIINLGLKNLEYNLFGIKNTSEFNVQSQNSA